MFNFHNAPPLSLYIHFPWCVRKCPYCDFNSHAVTQDIPEQLYISALIEDLQSMLPWVWGRRLVSIFMGGGTPSLFSAASIDLLLSQVRSLLPFSADMEITLEANPGTVEQQRFYEYRKAGVNRLSIGVQSFNDNALQRLGRIHTGNEASVALESAREAGFDNINIDLMFGLPDQTLAHALHDIDMLLALAPSHASYYQLTLEPNTQFAHQPPTLPEDDLIYQMQSAAHVQLHEAGYVQYEVSAFSKTGRQCAHNLNYWQFGDYLGIGAGAHSKITDAGRQTITRLSKRKNPRDYMQAITHNSQNEGMRTLSRQEAAFEFMLNALRLNQGFAVSLFEERTGLSITQVSEALQGAQQRQFIHRTLHEIVPSEQGRLFLNDLQAMFLPE